MLSKSMRGTVVTVGSVLCAGSALALDWLGAGLGALIVLAMLGAGIVARVSSRGALPTDPTKWAQMSGAAEWSWIALVTAVASAALFFGIELGDKLDKSIAGAAGFGAVVGIAFVKLLDSVSSDSDWIANRTDRRAKKLFKDSYSNQFDDGTPPGPLPRRRTDDNTIDSDCFLAVHDDERHGGWDAGGREGRAKDIQLFLDGQPGITWANPG